MTRVIIGAFDYLRKALTRARSPSQIPLPFRAVLGRSNISGIHPEILLVHGIVVINNNYNYAMDKQYFRMNSGNITSPEHYPFPKEEGVGVRINFIHQPAGKTPIDYSLFLVLFFPRQLQE
jgi:hypothetical protein